MLATLLVVEPQDSGTRCCSVTPGTSRPVGVDPIPCIVSASVRVQSVGVLRQLVNCSVRVRPPTRSVFARILSTGGVKEPTRDAG